MTKRLSHDISESDFLSIGIGDFVSICQKPALVLSIPKTMPSGGFYIFWALLKEGLAQVTVFVELNGTICTWDVRMTRIVGLTDEGRTLGSQTVAGALHLLNRLPTDQSIEFSMLARISTELA